MEKEQRKKSNFLKERNEVVGKSLAKYITGAKDMDQKLNTLA